ncbi:senecionine N-oxygenase-like [Contarinia nasturtii]|uniref:senecionine N-oxygenase-like n=1 Tax=Contarinia nasturtii TaxID=265458 RepID=UPI0012D3E9D0|nr:senecionine N-oxygenase-like [Contarinia nasturtii]
MKNFTIYSASCVAILIASLQSVKTAPVNDDKTSDLKFVVIGAGVSGIASAKHLLAQGYNVTIYEQSEDIGGTWFYTNQTGKNQYGIKVHSAMYRGLSANLPRKIMHYKDFDYQNITEHFTRPSQAEVFEYIQSYVDHFDIRKHVKLNHLVVRVHPIEKGQWEVIVKNLPNGTFHTLIYDYVFVCNGKYSSPHYPSISGMEEFKGKMLHSHDYRDAEAFRNESVLIIGNGASAMDIFDQLEDVASRLTISNKRKHYITMGDRYKRDVKSKINFQHEVVRLNSTAAEFIDGSNVTFSVIIFATGYNYSFPMLSVDTGIHVEDNSVSPLFKQIFNIEHPTMVFIGIVSETISFITYDFQVQFAMKFITGEKKLPSKVEMYKEEQTQLKILYDCKEYTKRHTHNLQLPELYVYFKELSEMAEINNYPGNYIEMYFEEFKRWNTTSYYATCNELNNTTLDVRKDKVMDMLN